MNLQSIKEEFKNYYVGELARQGQDTSAYDSEHSSISIFQHKDEFKNFLKTHYNADSSLLSKSLSDIMKMQVVDGKLQEVDSQNKNKEKGPGASQDDDLMNQLIQEALDDENVKAALDLDGNNELDSEEIGIFMQNIQGISNDEEQEDSENDINNSELSFDDLAKGFEDIQSGEYQKYDVVLDDETLKGDDAVESLLNEMFLNKKVFNELDADNDGILSLEEQEKFKDYIKKYDGYNDKISQADIKSAYYDILDGKFSYDKEMKVDNTKEEVVNPQIDNQSYSATAPVNSQGAYYGGAPSNSYGASYNSSGATVQAKTIDNMTLDELKSEQTTKTQEVQEAQNNLNAVYSGENEAIKSAQDELDSAKENYDKALDSEIESNPELKQLFIPLKNTIKQIEDTQKSIQETELQITKTESELTKQNSTLDADKANLQALESAKSSLLSKQSGADEKLQAKIDSQLASLEQQITAAKKKVEDDEKLIKETTDKLNELKTGENGLEKLNENLDKLKQSKDEQEEKIDSIISDTTKQAKEAYDKALDNFEQVKTQEVDKAKEVLAAKQEELNKINEKVNEKQALKTQKENGVSTYDFDFETNLTANQASDLEKFKNLYEQNQEKYQKVEDATGVPAQLIAAIHWRESTGNFNTYLHNGDPLGKPTVHVPAGIYFEDWSEAAIHAINSHNPEIVDSSDVNTLYTFAEEYNGRGYRNRGVNTPYVWAGTTNYQAGKFVADHVYDPSAVDKQLGVAVMLQAICD